jgi:hypothetical protein
MNVTPAKIRANARRLDRLNIKAATVLATMQRGEALLLEYRWCGSVWCLSGGRDVPDEVAQVVIKSESVVGVGDALFNDTPAQTRRWVEEDQSIAIDQTHKLGTIIKSGGR